MDERRPMSDRDTTPVEEAEATAGDGGAEEIGPDTEVEILEVVGEEDLEGSGLQYLTHMKEQHHRCSTCGAWGYNKGTIQTHRKHMHPKGAGFFSFLLLFTLPTPAIKFFTLFRSAQNEHAEHARDSSGRWWRQHA